jgi:hypothetical protein
MKLPNVSELGTLNEQFDRKEPLNGRRGRSGKLVQGPQSRQSHGAVFDAVCSGILLQMLYVQCATDVAEHRARTRSQKITRMV